MDESLLKSGQLDPRLTPQRPYQIAEDTSSPIVERRTHYDMISERTPHVWTKLFKILEIYNRIPETKFVDKVLPKDAIHTRDIAVVEEGLVDHPDSQSHTSRNNIPMQELKRADSARAPVVTALKQNIVVKERTKLVIAGFASVKKVLVLARISGLKLETVLSGVEGSVLHKTRVKGLSRKTLEETLATVRVNGGQMILQEGGIMSSSGKHVKPDITVLQCSVGQCQALYDALPPTKARAHNLDCVLLALGLIKIEIPQHALQLHTVMARETEQITKVVQELRKSTRIRSGFYEDYGFDGNATLTAGVKDRQTATNSASPRFRQGNTPISPRPTKTDDPDAAPQRPPRRKPVKGNVNAGAQDTDQTAAPVEEELMLKPTGAIKFLMAAEGMTVEAALLASLKAQYAIGQVSSQGVISRQSQFLINVDKHSLVFESRLGDVGQTIPLQNIPDKYSFDLPSINVLANQKPINFSGIVNESMDIANVPQQLVVTAEMGPIINRLDSTILNQLIFIQRAFLSEISDVVQKIASGSPKNQPWNILKQSSMNESNFDIFDDISQGQSNPPSIFKYNIKFRIQEIELTATSPTNSAVQLKTGLLQVVLANKDDALSVGRTDQHHPLRLFTEASGRIELYLGQLYGGNYPGQTPEFSQLSFFKTRVQVTSASEETGKTGDSPVRDGLKITLSKPQILIRPTAIDKGLMLWLNYKKAYDFWVEQRNSGQLVMATRKLQSAISQIKAPAQPTASMLPFIEFKIENLGIALPLFVSPKNAPVAIGDTSTLSDPIESSNALVITLERSQISAFTSQALVSRGTFEHFCLRFADDFSPIRESSWAPQPMKVATQTGAIVNIVQDSCSVPDGSFSICSKTISPLSDSENTKLLVSVQWQTQGVYVRVGVGIGEKLSLLFNTLTLMSGEDIDSSSSELDKATEKKDTENDKEEKEKEYENIQKHLPPVILAVLNDPSASQSQKENMITSELERISAQIATLRQMEADSAKIAAEELKLNALENLWTTEFKRTFVSRFQDSGQQLLKDNLSRLAGVEPTQGVANASMNIRGSSKKYHRRSKSSGSSSISQTSKGMKNVTLPTHREHDSNNPSLAGSQNQMVSRDNSNDELGGKFDIGGRSSKLWEAETSSASGLILRQRGPSQTSNVSTPVVDKEFNFNLQISRGECWLYPNRENDEKSDGRSPRLDPSARRMINMELLNTGPQIDVEHATTFYLPGLVTRVRYMSAGVDVPGRVAAAKRGTLHAWLTVQTFPTETVLTPSLIRFFEQVFDPIVDQITQTSSFYSGLEKNATEPSGGAPADAESSSRTGVASSADSVSSTANIDEGTQAVSMMSGSTGAASSGFGLGSVPVDVAVYVSVQPSVIKFNSFPTSRLECRLQLPSMDVMFSTQNKTTSDVSSPRTVTGQGKGSQIFGNLHEEISGGLCITTSLSNFNFFIYHPLAPDDAITRPPRSSTASRPSTESGDVSKGKNPVSIQLGTIRINFARYWTKKISISHSIDSPSTRSQNDELNIKLSIVCDIGSAQFKLDVRRLNEIMSVMKAWYSKQLARRLVFGSGATPHPAPSHPSHGKELSIGIKSKHYILPAIRLSKLEVELRMDQIMYKTEWDNDDFRIYGCVVVDNDGSNFVKIHTRLGKSKLATSGLVAGQVSVSGFNAFAMVKNSRSKPPVHRLYINLHEIESRIEYRGNLILIARIGMLCVHFFTKIFVDTVLQGRRKSGTSVNLNGEISTEHLHVIISSISTSDLARLAVSVKESIDKQLADSKQLWTNAFGDLGNRPLATHEVVNETKQEKPQQTQQHLRLHRHWQPILNKMVKAKAHWLPVGETENILFNSTMTLSGKNVVLACFHGPSFQVSQWGLFVLRGASSTFTTSPQMIESPQIPPNIHINQILEFQLAQWHHTAERLQGESAGTNISGIVMRIIDKNSAKLTRSLKTTGDWFHYAFSCSEVKDLDDFSFSSLSDQKSMRPNFVHDTEVIFKLPAASLHLRSEQNQTLALLKPITGKLHFYSLLIIFLNFGYFTEWNEPKLGPRPIVACAFQTEFLDHLFVSFNAESIMFLHDLIRNYITTAAGAQSMDSSPKSRPSVEMNTAETLQMDGRMFMTTQWSLNPTVRLLTFGREIETGGIEKVLVRLGFKQAQSTIPKWIQRGVNDSLDALAVAILEKMVESAFSLDD